MSIRKTLSPGEQLLAEALERCMDQKLSAIPGEREIAEMHTFSDAFNSNMEKIITETGRKSGKIFNFNRKENYYGFRTAAVFVMCALAIGGAVYFGISLVPEIKNETTSVTTETASVKDEEMNEIDETEITEEFTAADAAAGTEQEAVDESALPQAEFMGQMLSPAGNQVIPTEQGLVKSLVNCPVIATDAEEIIVTIGNMEEYPIYYYESMDLEVLIDGVWYLVPCKQSAMEEQTGTMITLEPNMAQDESISLADYELDYKAENYRIVTYMENMTLCAEFLFEDPEELGLDTEE